MKNDFNLLILNMMTMAKMKVKDTGSLERNVPQEKTIQGLSATRGAFYIQTSGFMGRGLLTILEIFIKKPKKRDTF